MRALVTGASGFIGSHLCDRLLADGQEVVGIDCFTDYYARSLKEQNLACAREYRSFKFLELDLATDDLCEAVDGAQVVYHLAGRSGLRDRRRGEFAHYVRDNLLATERVLESLVDSSITRLVYASSSSVYGDTEKLPTKESNVPRPLSSYGVTKLAGENLVHRYHRGFGVPVTSLRYFTIFGPRQRPDMAVARFMQAAAVGEEVEVLGDGDQSRDFTYITDAIEATIRAATADVVGKVLNIGGGSRATINVLLAEIEEITETSVRRRYLTPPPEDQRHTAASINLARQHLSWEPRVSLRDGLANQWSWLRRGSQGIAGRSMEVAV